MDPKYAGWSRDTRLFVSTIRVLHPELAERYKDLFAMFTDLGGSDRVQVYHPRSCGYNVGASVAEVMEKEPSNNSIPELAIPLRTLWIGMKVDREALRAIHATTCKEERTAREVHAATNSLQVDERTLRESRLDLSERGIAKFEAKIQKGQADLAKATAAHEQAQQEKRDLNAALFPAPSAEEKAHQRAMVAWEIKVVREAMGDKEDASILRHLADLNVVAQGLDEEPVPA